MSALISLYLEDRLVTKIVIPANDLTDQQLALDLLRGYLVESVLKFNESQIDEEIYRKLQGGDHNE